MVKGATSHVRHISPFSVQHLSGMATAQTRVFTHWIYRLIATIYIYGRIGLLIWVLRDAVRNLFRSCTFCTWPRRLSSSSWTSNVQLGPFLVSFSHGYAELRPSYALSAAGKLQPWAVREWGWGCFQESGGLCFQCFHVGTNSVLLSKILNPEINFEIACLHLPSLWKILHLKLPLANLLYIFWTTQSFANEIYNEDASDLLLKHCRCYIACGSPSWEMVQPLHIGAENRTQETRTARWRHWDKTTWGQLGPPTSPIAPD